MYSKVRSPSKLEVSNQILTPSSPDSGPGHPVHLHHYRCTPARARLRLHLRLSLLHQQRRQRRPGRRLPAVRGRYDRSQLPPRLQQL